MYLPPILNMLFEDLWQIKKYEKRIAAFNNNALITEQVLLINNKKVEKTYSV